MSEFQKYIRRYLDLVLEEDLHSALQSSNLKTLQIFDAVEDSAADYRYAVDKWSLKEVLQHLIDCERIFQFRALAIARKEPDNLPGFNEENYADHSGAAARPLAELIAEYTAVRTSGALLFKSFTVEMLTHKGLANGNSISVEEIGKLISGHNQHHLNVIEERYFNKIS